MSVTLCSIGVSFYLFLSLYLKMIDANIDEFHVLLQRCTKSGIEHSFEKCTQHIDQAAWRRIQLISGTKARSASSIITVSDA